MLFKRKDLLLKKKSVFLLACDQGLEHGPGDFNQKNIDPAYIMNIAKEGQFDGMIFQRGVAEKYYDASVPLIVKLNGKTAFSKDDPFSPLICTAKEAYDIGACAIGYTVFVGSDKEAKIFEDAHKVIMEARKLGMATIGWMYPRGRFVKKPDDAETIAYAARVGLELGFDFVKLRQPKQLNKLPWIVQSAGKARVLMAGGAKMPEVKLAQYLHIAKAAGATGLAIGRNVWQDPEPVKVAQFIKDNFMDHDIYTGPEK